jgi:2-phosphoglycerate kinase
MGKATKKNVLTGFNLLTNEYRGTIIRIIKSYQSVGKSLIVEGVQATPQIFSEIKTKNKIGIYLEILPKKQQFARFEMKNRHMKVKNKLWYENYDCIKLIDKYEKHHARMGNFFLVKNRNIDDTVSKIINYLTQC